MPVRIYGRFGGPGWFVYWSRTPRTLRPKRIVGRRLGATGFYVWRLLVGKD